MGVSLCTCVFDITYWRHGAVGLLVTPFLSAFVFSFFSLVTVKRSSPSHSVLSSNPYRQGRCRARTRAIGWGPGRTR